MTPYVSSTGIEPSAGGSGLKSFLAVIRVVYTLHMQACALGGVQVV
jgi:hypothetical protein